jgi:hypothetical protein
MKVKHWHKWEHDCTYSGSGGVNGSVKRCECGARKRTGTKGTRLISEYARKGESFEPIATGSGPNMPMFNARAEPAAKAVDRIAELEEQITWVIKRCNAAMNYGQADDVERFSGTINSSVAAVCDALIAARAVGYIAKMQ